MKISFSLPSRPARGPLRRPGKFALVALMLALGGFNYALPGYLGLGGVNLWLATLALMLTEAGLLFELLRKDRQRPDVIWLPGLLWLLLLCSLLAGVALDPAASVKPYLTPSDPGILIYPGMALLVPLMVLVLKKLPLAFLKQRLPADPADPAQSGASAPPAKVNLPHIAVLLASVLVPFVYGIELYQALGNNSATHLASWPILPPWSFLALLLAFAACLGKLRPPSARSPTSAPTGASTAPASGRPSLASRIRGWFRFSRGSRMVCKMPSARFGPGFFARLWSKAKAISKRDKNKMLATTTADDAIAGAPRRARTSKRPSKALLLVLMLGLFLFKLSLAIVWGMSGGTLWLASLGILLVEAALLFECVRKDGQGLNLAWMPMVVWSLVLVSVVLSASLSQVESALPYLLHAEPTILIQLGISSVFPLISGILQKFNSGDWLGLFGALRNSLEQGKAALHQVGQSLHGSQSTPLLTMHDLPLLLATVVGPVSYGMQLFDSINAHAAGGLAQWPLLSGGHYFATILGYVSHLSGIGLNLSVLAPLLGGAMAAPAPASPAASASLSAVASPTHELVQQMSEQLAQHTALVNSLADRLERLSKDHGQSSQNANRNLNAMQSQLAGIVSELKNAQQRQQRHADTISALDRKLGDVASSVRDMKARR